MAPPNGVPQLECGTRFAEAALQIPDEGPIKPATYRVPRSPWNVADFDVTIPGGWTVQYGHVYAKHQDTDAEVSVYSVVVDEIYTDACEGEGVTRPVGPEPFDLVTALREQPGPHAHRPHADSVGGYETTRIKLTTPEDLDLTRCRLGEIGLQVWYAAPADKYLVLLDEGLTRVYVVDVDGERQVFVTQIRPGTPPRDRRELAGLLLSIRIRP